MREGRVVIEVGAEVVDDVVAAQYILVDTVEIAVQVNGKVRGRIKIGRETPETEVIAQALADGGVRAHVAGKQIRKQVVVPGKLVSFVVG
jgi:leucyl-tRNA synthetase